MEPETILATARSGDAPGTWVVWPLRRQYIRNSILRWLAVAVVGFPLLILASISTLPDFLSLRGFSFVLTGILLLALAALAFGSLGIAIYDSWRLSQASAFWLVITPDDYVKAEPGGKVTHVPLEYVEAITLKGVRVPMETAETPFTGVPTGINPLFRLPFRQAAYRRQRATPSSLAFVDGRTSQEVVVATDAMFDELVHVEYVLSMQTDAKQRQLNRSRSQRRSG
jgi:hypothetical protein